MTDVAVPETGQKAGFRPSAARLALAGRVMRMEIRHSAFVWVIPLLVLLFIYDPYRTAAGYPPLWPLRSTVVLNKFWPDMVIFSSGFAAWAGSREGRRGVGDLLATTARPAWTRQLLSLAGTASWVVGTFLAGVLVLYVATSRAAAWGGPPIWPVAVGVAGMLAVCAVAFAFGALFPGRFTAPIVAVGITVITLAAFRQSVGDIGGSTGAVGVLSPDGAVPRDDWGLFAPVSAGVPIVQVMFMLGLVLAAAGVLGLSPRTGGAGWRGALAAAAAGGARLRTAAVSLLAAGVALAVAAFVLAGTANVKDPTGTLRIPAIDNSLAGGAPIPYTPACSVSHGISGFTVCVHPAYRPYLSRVTVALNQAVGELAGLPGVPRSARQVAAGVLPSAIPPASGAGQIAGGVYEFDLSAIGLNSRAPGLRSSLQQDLVHAIIVGAQPVTSPGASKVPGAGSLARQAVMDGVLKALGTPQYPEPGSGNGPVPAGPVPPRQAQVLAAAARFAALPAAARHAWLAANLAALKAGTVTLARIP